MDNQADDLEAVRTITKTLEPFDNEVRERIIRWVIEKLGLPFASKTSPTSPSPQPQFSPVGTGDQTRPASPPRDLKTFIAEKKPNNDVQFAASIAYYYRFEAPQSERREEIDGAILLNGCRLAGRKRLKRPRTTLNNAKNLGYLDAGSEPGKFVLNTVGENLIAMTLPNQPDGTPTRKPPEARRRENTRGQSKRD